MVVQRKGPRSLKNAEEIAEAALVVFSVHGQPARVQVVFFEDMPFASQLQLMAVTDILIGVDGTGLFNANFMSEGSVVVRIKPYMLDTLVPNKSNNFKVIWRALGIQQLEWSSNRTSTTTPSVPLQVLLQAVKHADQLPFETRSPIALTQQTYVTIDTLWPVLEEAANAVNVGARC